MFVDGSQQQQGERTFEILVESEPAGARIELNDGYEGVTPLKLSVLGNLDGTWKLDTQITALPVNPGQQVQTKFFHSFDHHQIPKRIFFDMSLIRVQQPSIDVNVNTGDPNE
ncbi:MAG: PEGA domain-containing protein [Chthoniobacterales bacterium]